ncbi:DivIVA domain-containing protein [Spinactinospora alkalitolerans]|uniref:DivIVA domain-containing protein n=1 Tax=Spinactinospora alkalitolerans TaxID=687207 RepID=A0A852TP23_9ACTN|nr:DivIVA domain-containing protein [Spinactinospora alkalitolerans]
MTAILILTALAALAVLVGVALVVMGRGGQLARFEADHPPLELPSDRPVTGSDVANVRLPLALWGYHVRAVDEVLQRLAAALKERDARIAELEERLAEPGRHTPHRVWYPRHATDAPEGGDPEEDPGERRPSVHVRAGRAGDGAEPLPDDPQDT